MAEFVLVHGAWHRPEHWTPTARLLRDAGHDVVAVDLPSANPQATLRDYAAVVVAAAAPYAGPFVVGHSLAGIVVPLVAAQRDVGGLVLVAAFVPEPGRSMNATLRAWPGALDDLSPGQERTAEGGSRWVNLDLAAGLFYGDIPAEQGVHHAALLRDQTWGLMDEPSPLEQWPATPTTYVVCSHDAVVNPAWQRAAAARVGARVVEVDSDHSPFLSHPAALAAVIADATA